jgi:hypothetical protein
MSTAADNALGSRRPKVSRKHPITSHRASYLVDAASTQGMILQCIRECGEKGAIYDDVEKMMQERRQDGESAIKAYAITTNFSELMERCYIWRDNKQRKGFLTKRSTYQLIHYALTDDQRQLCINWIESVVQSPISEEGYNAIARWTVANEVFLSADRDLEEAKEELRLHAFGGLTAGIVTLHINDNEELEARMRQHKMVFVEKKRIV